MGRVKGVQSIAKGSRRAENQSEHVRRPQNCCTKQTYLVQAQNRTQRGQRPGNDADAPSGRTDRPIGQIDAKSTARTPEVISITPDRVKSPNLPIGPENWCIAGADGLRNRVDASNTHTGMQSIVTNLKTATSARKNVKTHQLRSKMRSLPLRLETETAKRPGRWPRQRQRE